MSTPVLPPSVPRSLLSPVPDPNAPYPSITDFLSNIVARPTCGIDWPHASYGPSFLIAPYKVWRTLLETQTALQLPRELMDEHKRSLLSSSTPTPTPTPILTTRTTTTTPTTTMMNSIKGAKKNDDRCCYYYSLITANLLLVCSKNQGSFESPNKSHL